MIAVNRDKKDNISVVVNGHSSEVIAELLGVNVSVLQSLVESGSLNEDQIDTFLNDLTKIVLYRIKEVK